MAGFPHLDNLRKIANSQGTQANLNDFFFWARRLAGVQ